MIKITFDEPTNGWLPVTIRYQDCEEVFFASDIPVDPVMRLEEVLDSAITGFGGEVWWHLEPSGYYLSVIADKTQCHVRLDYSIDSKATTREIVFDFYGSFDEVIIPIWRALRKLQSQGYDQFMPSKKGMDSITRQIKEKRKHT
ncbi:hypothetical protein A9Q99_08805 [Gammaproteobacteria bacterium 45_16_T64]|nr:hypothetical protein A9Q99_08805 [Gammaproteobacteria bacterium 45_16_T64]